MCATNLDGLQERKMFIFFSAFLHSIWGITISCLKFPTSSLSHSIPSYMDRKPTFSLLCMPGQKHGHIISKLTQTTVSIA